MDILSFLGLIALTTALAGMYELFTPAIRQMEILNPEDVIVKNKPLAYVVFFLFSLLFFVPLLPVVLIPSWGTRFRNSLIGSITGQKN